MDFVEVEVLNWARFNPRRDYKRPTWFALNNHVLEDAMFSEFSGDEFRAWIYILCQASQKNSATVMIFFKHASSACSVTKKTMLSALQKLEIAGSIRLTNGSVQITNAKVHNLYATDRQTDIHTRAESEPVPGPDGFPWVPKAWNEIVRSLPKIRDWSEDRIKAAEKTLRGRNEDYWREACEMVEASEFLSGRNGKWTACNIDWVLKPKNFRKITEGTYGRGDKPTAPAHGPECGLADV